MRSIGAWLTTSLTTDGPGTQINEIWIYSRSSNAAYSPTGILIAQRGFNLELFYNKFYGLSRLVQMAMGSSSETPTTTCFSMLARS